MGRPCKPAHTLKTRWDALYVTPAERAEVAAAAAQAGQSVSRYLLAAHRGQTRNGAGETARIIQSLGMAEQQLAALASQFQAHARPIDAIGLQAHLLAIERMFRHAALPWSVVLDVTAEGEGPPCS